MYPAEAEGSETPPTSWRAESRRPLQLPVGPDRPTHRRSKHPHQTRPAEDALGAGRPHAAPLSPAHPVSAKATVATANVIRRITPGTLATTTAQPLSACAQGHCHREKSEIEPKHRDVGSFKMNVTVTQIFFVVARLTQFATCLSTSSCGQPVGASPVQPYGSGSATRRLVAVNASTGMGSEVTSARPSIGSHGPPATEYSPS